MRKIIPITLLILLPIISYSQKKMGVLIGLNNSSISEGVLGQVSITDNMGFHLGGFYEFDLNEKIKFRPKLVYSQQGNRDGGSSSIEHIDYKSNYFNIPLNFKFYESIYILAGPQIGILVSEEKYSPFIEGETFDLGINLGIGHKIKDFFLELNLYQGLTKAIDKPNYDGELVKGTNTLIQASIGYYIF
ncbi:outer membrane beta-barrel protein [Zunongwangia sp. HRR-M8]|uniref:outer membrane beta-barrel protein n=1 Tax=Zunongwangia sp. HRR-M8 TaxID=3015170 RepID=UPI0022DDF189|nr:outer membrane beta-barrel protein [Zunongwangia sp. HRR-M8]WBL23818.1 outer membrane beta-barrel protein [Zunongwangia sp. HRR-M8]